MLWLGLTLVSFGQNISLDAQASASGFAKDQQGISVDWTLGFSFAQVVQQEHHLTEGFQQGNLLLNNTILPDTATFRESAVETISESSLLNLFLVTVYPNPTTSSIFLQVGDLDKAQQMDIFIYDLEGKQLFSQSQIVYPQQKISIQSIENFPPGVYSLNLIVEGDNLQTLAFIKQ